MTYFFFSTAENNSDCTIDKQILNTNATKKPLTAKPSIKASARRMMHAFITRRKRPKVKIVIGKVSNTKIGLTISFNNANTTATTIALKYPSTVTPGRSFARSTTIIAVTSRRKITFII